MQLVKAGALVRFPNTMKLYSLSLLILPSTSGVEQAFSIINLLVSPLWTILNENNVDHLMWMCLDGPDKLDVPKISIPTSKTACVNPCNYNNTKIINNKLGSQYWGKTWKIRKKFGILEKPWKTWKTQRNFLENHSTQGKLRENV